MTRQLNLSLFFLIGTLVFVFATCKKPVEVQHGDSGNEDPIVLEKADSLIAFAGKNRVKLSWYIKPEANIAKAIIYWENREQSKEIAVTQDGRTYDTVIEDLDEKKHLFTIYLYDEQGNESERAVITAMAYGDQYQSTLANRQTQHIYRNHDHVSINWQQAPEGLVFTEVVFYHQTGGKKVSIVAADVDVTDLADYKALQPFRHRSAYLPEVNAIDTFYTDFTKEEVPEYPDFSFAGYNMNRSMIPLAPVKITLTPGPGDDGGRIQEALNTLSQMPLVNGIRGALLLKAGTYEVAGQLTIGTSGVVLRGEGQGPNGTIVHATGTTQYEMITVKGGGANSESGNTRISADKIVVGSRKIPVTTASGFNPGDTILIRKTVNNDWIAFLDMAQYGWAASGYQLPHKRVITHIDADTLYVDIPLVDAIEKQFGGGYVAKLNAPGFLTDVGVENLRLVSAYSGDEDENHGWQAITLRRVKNSWVRNVTALYFGHSCVSLYDADFNTIQDCAMLDPKSITTGGRKYPFYIDHGTGNLFQRCYARGGRHDYVTGSRVAGPNVYLDCYSIDTHSDIGPHHRWATGTLFDNIYGGQLRVQNRKSSGSGHGWAGAQTMFWNSHATKGFVIESPPGAQNWCIGCSGSSRSGNGYWESWGTPVSIRSIFIDQLAQRTDATLDVLTSMQRNSSIWNDLAQWAGNENPLVGL